MNMDRSKEENVQNEDVNVNENNEEDVDKDNEDKKGINDKEEKEEINEKKILGIIASGGLLDVKEEKEKESVTASKVNKITQGLEDHHTPTLNGSKLNKITQGLQNHHTPTVVIHEVCIPYLT